MRVFVTGATGFIGRALVLRLRRDGHQPVAWVRSPAKAKSLLGDEAELIPIPAGDRPLREVLASCDAVVNLAGESLLHLRWTKKKQQRMTTSRVEPTRRLIQAMADLPSHPKVFVSRSAVGYYGDRGTKMLREDSLTGHDFLARLCADWEEAALPAEALGVRLVLLRTGMVLGREGGLLEKVLPLFRAGLGANLGTGEQFVSWIHLHDLTSLIVAALVDDRYRGPLNAVSPNPVTNREFTRAVSCAVQKPAFLTIPGGALHAGLGEGVASVLLSSQRVVPAKLEGLGYTFKFPELGEALRDLVECRSVEFKKTAGAGRSRGEGRYILLSKTELDRPVDQVFDFFSKPFNLGVLTPSKMGIRIKAAPKEVERGSAIDYRLRVGPFPVRWRTRIEQWEPGQFFVDTQEKGPYRAWRHEHRFRTEGPRTVMEDGVYYAPPYGWIGGVVNRLFLQAALRRLFGFRADAIRLRFGSPKQIPSSEPAP